MSTKDIWDNLAESIRLEKDGNTVPVPVEDIRALLAERNANPTTFVVREFMGTNGEGYRIEGHNSDPKFRYVWLEPGEPDDVGEWRYTLAGAIKAAWEDWDSNGQGYHWAQWSKDLAHSAGHKETR